MREKRRPTLDELREMPVQLWQLELAQIAEDAGSSDDQGNWWIGAEARKMMDDPELTPEMVVQIRGMLDSSLREAEVVAASVAI